MSFALGMPLRLFGETQPGKAYDPEYLEPKRYAFCLLDLAVDKKGQQTAATRVFAKSTFKDKWICQEEKVSDQIKWQLLCRTNKNGTLALVPQRLFDELILSGHTDELDDPKECPPLYFYPGMRFNLHWAHKSNKKAFLNAYQGDTLLSEEAQLHQCTMYFNEQDEASITALVVKALKQKAQEDAVSTEDVKRALNKVRSLCVDPAHAKRVYVNCNAKNGEGGVGAMPFLRLQDEDLYHALELARRITDASEAPLEKEAYADVARLERVVQIIEEYKKQKAQGNEDWINRIRDRAVRYEEFDEYSGKLHMVEKGIQDTKRHIEACAEHLVPLVPGALAQAKAHYDDEDAARYAKRITNALGIALNQSIFDDFLASEKKYKQRIEGVDKVLKGKPPEDALETFLAGQKWFEKRAVPQSIGATSAVYDWVEQMPAQVIERSPGEAARALNRLNHWMGLTETAEDIDEKIPRVFEPAGEKLAVALKGSDQVGDVHLSKKVKMTGSAVKGLGAVASFANLGAALLELQKKPEFKETVKTLGSAAEVADLFKSARDDLMKKLGLSQNALVRIAGAAGVVVGVMQAADSLAKGNNIAVLGHMLSSCGGVIQVLGRGGFAGVVAAVLVVAGTVVVYWSLDEEEKFLVQFEEKYWEKITTDYYFLSDGDMLLQDARKYVSSRT